MGKEMQISLCLSVMQDNCTTRTWISWEWL